MDSYNKIRCFFYRCMLVIIIFLCLGIFCKKSLDYKDYIYKIIYEDNINFSFFKKFYTKYLGGVLPLSNFDKVVSVFDEDIVYDKLIEYNDGIKLMVSENYLVPLLDSGIVVYVGNKDLYGNVVIVESDNGVDIWYGNICDVSYKLYDRVDAGSYIGSSCNDYIYLVYSKGNTFLDYKDFFF